MRRLAFRRPVRCRVAGVSDLPACPKCKSAYTYEDRGLLVCPECAHEWSSAAEGDAPEEGGGLVVRDANGTQLHDGDSVLLRSAKEKHGLTTVLGPSGEEAPCLPEEPAMPKLRRERLSTGEEVHRLVSDIDEPSGQQQEERATLPRREAKAGNVTC